MGTPYNTRKLSVTSYECQTLPLTCQAKLQNWSKSQGNSFQEYRNHNAYQANETVLDCSTLCPSDTQATSPNECASGAFQENLHKDSVPFTSSRPKVIPDYIPFPWVDQEIVTKQRDIISTVWPDISDSAAEAHPDFAELYTDVKSFNLPNFLGARRSLSSGLHLHSWETLLQGYHDAEICYFLRYGWPVGYHNSTPPAAVSSNHPSADAHHTHIEDFIAKELSHKALAGPFKQQPFRPWTRQSPLMTRPKRDTDSRRVIVDLSFPQGSAVNDGINIKSIYGRDTSYTLPTIGDLTEKVKQIGPSAWIWKADLARAYRQLRVDPLDAPLLGLAFNNNIYLDLCPSFGCRSSSGACQRTSMAVCYLMAKKGWFILAFLDDFAGVQSSKAEASQAYDDFLSLTTQLGLQLATDKCSPPSKCMQWLGYDINVKNMTVAIPEEKLLQVLDDCTQWAGKSKVSRVMIQSITGKLLHLAHCVKGARKFTARILSKLRHMAAQNQLWTTVDKEFLADIKWFQLYASAANGICLIDPPRDHIYIECDSSLTGGGGNSAAAFYKWKYTSEHLQRFKAIHHLEAVNLLVAYRTLCPSAGTNGSCIVMLTDNQASACALQTGKTKDHVLAACSRELWLEAARADHIITIQHKPGELIPLADALSRAYENVSKAALASQITQDRSLHELIPVLSGYNFFDRDI